jgi:hypothetical protein
MPERQQRRTRDSKPRGRLQIKPKRHEMRTARVMVVVLHRAAITFVVISLRSLTRFMIPTAGFGDFAALAGGTARYREDTGVQAREHAEKQQGCENDSHQVVGDSAASTGNARGNPDRTIRDPASCRRNMRELASFANDFSDAPITSRQIHPVGWRRHDPPDLSD